MTSAMNVLGYIVYGRDHSRTVILCPRGVNDFRRSCVDHERCTAIPVASSMLLSVCVPHSCRDEEDHIRGAGDCVNIMTEGKMAGAVDFNIRGDINIEMKLGGTGEDLQGLTSLTGIVCKDPNAEEEGIMSSHTRKLRLLKDFNCSMTNTKVNNDDHGKYQSWRVWGSRVGRKPNDCIMESRDVQSATLFLNKTRLRTWDHFFVVVQIDGKVLRAKEMKKSWAGLDSQIRTKKSSLKKSRSARVTVVTA